tara:strand:- start:533 stop:1096 length:564 start_codon:yes stop_codon:yes gene_type:complete
MDAIDALVNRVSCGKLSAPAPSQEQRLSLYKAALRAADHGNLRPWRFLEVEGDALHALGAVFERAALAEDEGLTESQRERFLKMPLRAPLILVALACCEEHPKVPEWEQVVAAGAAVQNLLTAAFAEGVGAYWRTGSLVDSAVVREELDVANNEKIVGFVYLGTPAVTPKSVPDLKVDDFFRPWPSK